MEFQVDTMQDTIDPPARYCWCRAPTASEQDRMIHPWDQEDIAAIMAELMGVPTATAGIVDWQKQIYVSYKATYQIKNQNNNRTRFEALKFKARKDIQYYIDEGEGRYGYANPFNIAGSWLHRMKDATATPASDASNSGLKRERSQVQRVPPIQQKFSCKKKAFVLQPGGVKTITVRFKRWFTLMDIFGLQIQGATSWPTNPLCEFWKGQEWVAFKMYSEMADYKDGASVALTQNSTRTTPVALMGYQCNYSCLAPIGTTDNPGGKYVYIGSTGIQAAPVAGNIQNIVDSNFNIQVQANAV